MFLATFIVTCYYFLVRGVPCPPRHSEGEHFAIVKVRAPGGCRLIDIPFSPNISRAGAIVFVVWGFATLPLTVHCTFAYDY